MKTVTIPCLGYSVAADSYERDAKKVLLVLHGWGSSKKNQEELTRFLVDETGTTVLAMEYSGHDGGQFDVLETRPAQHFIEVVAAFDWIKEHYPGAGVSVLGTSYGGYLAAKLTNYREFSNLILRVPAIGKPRDFYNQYKEIDLHDEKAYRKEKDFLDNHPLFARESAFKGRTLVVWHEFDQYIPKELSDKYIEVFHADSYFAKGWEHSYKKDASKEEQLAYKHAISDWLKK